MLGDGRNPMPGAAATLAHVRSELFHHHGGLRPVAIPDAGHHLMLDNPLGTVAALRTQFAGWEREAEAQPVAYPHPHSPQTTGALVLTTASGSSRL